MFLKGFCIFIAFFISYRLGGYNDFDSIEGVDK